MDQGGEQHRPALVIERLPPDRELSLERVDRRRTHLWIVAGLFIVAASTALGVVLSSGGGELLPDSPGLRWALSGLAVAFIVYVIEQERILRRLTRALLSAEVLAASLRSRIRDLTTLSQVGRLVNSYLTMDEVLEVIIDAVTELTDAHRASVAFVEDDRLRIAVSRGDDVPPPGSTGSAGEGVAGWVVEHREPVLITGRLTRDQFPGHRDRGRRRGSSVCAPLIADGEVVGVLAVERPPGAEPFTEVEMRSVALFADQAATAVMNAQRFEETRATAERLADALERRGDFVAMLVHELKTPLTAILGMSQVLAGRAGELPADRRRTMVTTIREQAQRLSSMVQEVLQVASADAGADLRREELDLREVIEAGFQSTQAVASAREDTSRPLHLDCPDVLPPVVGDVEALRRVVNNPLENAVKYSPPGSPIHVRVDHRDAEVQVRVIDRGQGISPDELGSVFERFRRTSARTSGGVGLGLYIVRSLVTAHGGRVWVDSEVGRGSTFGFSLPAHVPEPVPEPVGLADFERS